MAIHECDCGKTLKVRDELAGKKVKCPGCGDVVLVVGWDPVHNVLVLAGHGI